ncbi:putative senescence regulator S40 [Lupinus albus]|uniref:Putative senescence regulator S40 n=1 Tax=Lupinus albus TaxID=3870 RepID=A0A6A4R989_LUPAL|nr:putative senescence regulator S40 [Lupinus albus]
MDPTIGSLHRRSSSDRLLQPFTISTTASSTGDDFNEAELFWSGDLSESEHNRHVITPPDDSKNHIRNFNRSLNSGILAALTEPDHAPVICRKSSISSSSSRLIPSLPRPTGSSDYLSQSVGSRKFQQSAPVKVPIMKIPRRRNGQELTLMDDDDDDDNDEMLPPHEIVARGYGVSPKKTCSVLEGVGRTLKGRDLRQVRNAIWRKTGFLD